MPLLETLIVGTALALALALRPWRLLAGGHLLAPLMGCVVLLPGAWALPSLSRLPLQLHWSGACMVLLMLGWPLAIPALVATALVAGALGQMDAAQTLALATWRGVVPATLALALGACVRRWLPRHLFVYLLARAFLGTVLCTFTAGLLARWAHDELAQVSAELSAVGLWLVAWSDAVVTGMLATIFVAFRPQWLATWSDQRYLGAAPLH